MKTMRIVAGTKPAVWIAVLALCLCVSFAGAQQLGVGTPQSALVFQPGVITTLTGTAVSGHTGDGGPASAATLTNGIRGIAADAAGDVYFADDTNDTIRVVYEGGATAAQLITAENPTVTSPQVGYIYVVAGGEGSSGAPASGALGTSARLKPGAGLSLDAAGDVYFNDTGTNKVWVIYAGGTGTAGTNLIALEAGVTSPVLGHLYAVAGNSSTSGYAGDGHLATASGVEFHGVNDMKLDAAGNMYIVDQGNNCLREVNAATGILTTIAGGASGVGTAGYSGDSGPAAKALINAPYGVAVDASNNIYIADKNNHVIRMIYAGGAAAAALISLENPAVTTPVAGNIYTIAGGGVAVFPFGGLATASKLNAPTMVAVDGAGDIDIAENGYNLILQVNAITGNVLVLAGNGVAGFAGDGGAATAAEMNGIRCMAVDAAGRIYVTDATNLRVREVGPQGLIVFPGQAANTTSAPQTIVLTNVGGATLNFTGGSPVFGGQDAGSFALDLSAPSNTCNLSPLPSAASCTLALTYTPTGSSSSAATLSFTTDGALSPQVIQLQGTLLPSTSTALQASAPSVVSGNTVTFTATVSGGASPAGSVSFFNNGTTLLGTVNLSAGVATLPYTSGSTGVLSVTAVYAGNPTNQGSTSGAVPVTVTGSGVSSTIVNSSSMSITQGQSITLTVTVNGSGSTPTGTVSFSDGSVVLGSGVLNGSGTATLTTSNLAVGPNAIQALYLGDATYAASSSAVTVQAFGTPVVTLVSSATTVNQGLNETLTATVTGKGAVPTGNVTFMSGTTSLGTAPLISGQATLTLSTLTGGADTLTAGYSGDTNYSAGTSPAITITVNVQSVAFAHPGGWLSAADITRIRTAVSNQTQPYYNAFLALPANPSTTYAPSASAVVTAGAVNSGSLTALQNDEENGWILAMKWVATGNTAYANAACGVIDGWSAVLTTMNGNNGSLRAGIYGGKFAETAEICAYANPGWQNKARAQAMFRQAFAQDIHDFSNSNVPNGNWETSCIHGMISIAVFLDDRELFDRAVNYYLFGQGNGRVDHYVINPAGQVQESGRDQAHTLDGINHLAETAEVAWHQGIDLYGAYGNRLLAGFEYTGEYLTGAGTPAFVPNRDAWNDPLNSYLTLSGTSPLTTTDPNWEMVYNHYVHRQGLSAPYTTQVVMTKGYEPEPASQDFAGMGTLAYTRSAGQVDPVTSTPVAPIILSGYSTSAGISLNWAGSVGAASYNVKRATQSGGPYTTIASVTGEAAYSYADSTATSTGAPYFYIVTAVNSFGESAAGAEVAASSGLPSPWSNTDIGTLGATGAGGTDYRGASSFALHASGYVIGNTATSLLYNKTPASYSVGSVTVPSVSDSLQFSYVSMNGDGQIVARVMAPLSPAASSAGLMMRDSLTSSAAMIANMAQTSGLALVTTRTVDGGTASLSETVQIGNSPTLPSLSAGPYWMMLARSGNTFTASVSSDDVHWTQIQQQTIAMPASIYVGLALASGNSTLPTDATFDEVSVPGGTVASKAPLAPANLNAVVGKGVQLTWSASAGATSYTLQRNSVMIAQVAAPQPGMYDAPRGTVRYIDYSGVAGTSYSYTVSANGVAGAGPASAAAAAVAPALTAPRIENSLRVPYATGTVGSVLSYQVRVAGQAAFSASALPAGLVIDPSSGLISGTPTQGGTFQATVTASNGAGSDSWPIGFTIAGSPLPAGMQQTDIGFLEAPGIAGTSGSAITATGAGVQVGAVCDDFHYAWYRLTGDGSITTQLSSVTTLSATTTLSETGIMMRNNLACNSLMIEAHAGIGGATSLGSLYRTASNAGGTDYIDVSSASGPNVTLPAYLRITRTGNSFSTYSSTDGTTWALMTTKTIAMNGTIYVGLDVNPEDDSPNNTSTGTYNNLAITSAASSIITSADVASGTVGVPFTFTVTSAISPASYSATNLPPGLAVDAGTGIISGTPTTSGVYSGVMGMTNGVANGTAPLTINIGKGTASVALTNLNQIYDGAAESATVTTTPAGLPVDVTYNTSSTVPVGAGTYQVSAVVDAAASYTGSATGTLTIAKAASSVSLASSSITSPAGSVTFTATVRSSAAGAPTGTVTFMSGSTALGTGTLANGTAAYTTATLPLGPSVITAVYGGDSNFTGSSSATLNETITDFTISASPQALVVRPGGSGVVTVTVTSVYGSLSSPVNLAVSGLPPGTTFFFNPSSVTPGSNPATSTLTLQAPTQISRLDRRKGVSGVVLPVAIGFLWPFAGGKTRRRRRLSKVLVMIALAAAIAGAGGCGSTGSAHTYSITVTGTSGTTQHTAAVGLVVH